MNNNTYEYIQKIIKDIDNNYYGFKSELNNKLINDFNKNEQIGGAKNKTQHLMKMLNMMNMMLFNMTLLNNSNKSFIHDKINTIDKLKLQISPLSGVQGLSG